MKQIKTIADFKRAMQVGTVWECQHRYIRDGVKEPQSSLGTRECGLSISEDFAFITERGMSYCSWPKKAEFSVEGNTVVITRSFCELRYTQVQRPD